MSSEGLEIGEIPFVTEEELESIDLEADKPQAVIANSSVRSVKNSSAKGDAEVAASSLLRDGVKAAYEAAELDYHVLQAKYQAGITNKGNYLSGEASYLREKADYITEEAELRLAYDSYRWMLKSVN